MSEITVTLAWLQTALAGAGGAQGVYRASAPNNAATPYIVITQYGASDIGGVAGRRLWARNLWLIEAWGPDAQYSAISAVADAIDAALQQKAHVAVQGGSILSSVREQARMYPQMVGNSQWTRIGGVYAIETRAP